MHPDLVGTHFAEPSPRDSEDVVISQANVAHSSLSIDIGATRAARRAGT
jgi:hypothetical protein